MAGRIVIFGVEKDLQRAPRGNPHFKRLNSTSSNLSDALCTTRMKVDIAVGQDMLLTSTRPHILSVAEANPSIDRDHVHLLGEANGFQDNRIQCERATNNVSSTSIAGASRHFQFFERIPATAQDLEGEKADHEDKLSRLFGQGDKAKDQFFFCAYEGDGVEERLGGQGRTIPKRDERGERKVSYQA